MRILPVLYDIELYRVDMTFHEYTVYLHFGFK